MRGQEQIIMEICIALSAAVQRTEEKFTPVRQAAAEDSEINIAVFDDVLRDLWNARVSLMSLADHCRKQIGESKPSSTTTNTTQVN